ncbi:MAG: PKD domain-containing protein [Methanoregulaceae archaeon]|nr:PKD domain-containing protein [Methanoregulaceae archaeon]
MPFCEHCGMEISQDDKFCEHCGATSQAGQGIPGAPASGGTPFIPPPPPPPPVGPTPVKPPKAKKQRFLAAVIVIVIIIIALLSLQGYLHTETPNQAQAIPVIPFTPSITPTIPVPGTTTTYPPAVAGTGYSGYTGVSPGIANPPTNPASFRVDHSSGTAPLQVSFYETSLGTPTKWSWDFDDGGGSSEENPVHIFTRPGTYDVTLSVVIGGKNYQNSQVITVGKPSGTPLQADFTLAPLTNTPPFSVRFTDTSTGSPTTWTWDFGDGTTSTLQNPTHSYASEGGYRITLTVTKSDGQRSSTFTLIDIYPDETKGDTTMLAQASTTTPTQAVSTIKTTSKTPSPTGTSSSSGCSYYSYTINGRTVSGTCCGALSQSMQCSAGKCYQVYTCNGVVIQ